MLDVTSLVLTGIEGVHPGQAKLTFAMARHAAVDLAQVVNARHDPGAADRLPEADLEVLRNALGTAGLRLRSDEDARDKLAKLRSMYEPYVHSTAQESDADAAAVEASGEGAATTGRRGRGIG